jgi:hypothetical protein
LIFGDFDLKIRAFKMKYFIFEKKTLNDKNSPPKNAAPYLYNP